jgi:hypothetical protein
VSNPHLIQVIHQSARPGPRNHRNQVGRLWDMHELLFHRQKALEEGDLRGYAAQLGLDVAAFDRDRASTAVLERIQRDVDLAVVGPLPPGRRAYLAELQQAPALVGQLALIQHQRHRLGRPQHAVVHAPVERNQARPLGLAGGPDRVQELPHGSGVGDRRRFTASATSGAFHSGSSAPSRGFAERCFSRTAYFYAP